MGPGEACLLDYCWKVVLKIESEDQKTHHNYQNTPTENDKKRILTALVGEGNPKCLKHFLLNSNNTAVANLKPYKAEFKPDGFLRLTLEGERKNSELIQQHCIEICVNQCLKENNCWDLLLCIEKGGILFPEELLKDYKEQKDDTSQYCQSEKIKVRDFVWDVNLKKENGALMFIKTTEIPILRDVLKEGLKQHANQSKNKSFELYEISFEEFEHSAKLIVTLYFLTDEKNILQTTKDTIEKWVSSSFKQKGHENVNLFYDKESAVEREVATNDPGSGDGANLDYSYSHEERLFTTNSEATIVQTDGVSAVTDQKNSTSTISHFNATLVDRDTRSGTQAPYSSKKADEKDGMSPPISHESIREHISAKTDVDYPEVHKFQDLKNQFFTIEWELARNENVELLPEEKSRCRAALSKSLNEFLKEEKMQDVRYDCINVTEKSLEITFARMDLSCTPDMVVLSAIVERCFSEHKLSEFIAKNGRVVSRSAVQAARKPGSGDDANLDNSQISSPLSVSHKERLSTTNSEATIVQTDGVSVDTDQKNSTSAISHLNTSLVDRDKRRDTQAPYSSKEADEKDGMSHLISHESIREQISAKTDVDYPEVHTIQDLKKQLFTIEWELARNENVELLPEEKSRCRAALSKSLNKFLKEEKMQDVRYDCINVTEKSLEITFARMDLSCTPDMVVLSAIVKRCFSKHKLSGFIAKNGRVVSRSSVQAARKGSTVMFYLYVPHDLADEINSIELLVYSKDIYSKGMERKGKMWKTLIVFPEPENEIWYNYKLKTTNSYWFFFKKEDEVLDQSERRICWGNIQRDIISITSMPLNEKHKDMGIAAHIEDIFQTPPYKIQYVFFEIDSLMARKSLKCSNWDGAFTMILDQPITEKLCFLLFFCIQRKYVTCELFKNMNMASKIWAKVQHLGEESKDVCVKFVGEIFRIYEASSLKCSPLHFINSTQSVLDIPSLHKVLLSRSSYPVHSCSESLSCLETALTLILNKDGESKLLYDIVCLIFDNIPENEVLEGLRILQEFDATEEKQKLKENAQKHVLANVENIMTGKVKSSNFQAMKEIFSKVEGDLRSALVVHCESNIIYQINNQEGFRHDVWKDLENLCKQNMLFQTIDQQILLLRAVLKMPSDVKLRNFVKYLLMNFQNKECESAKELLGKAYEVLLSTANVTSSEEELMSHFADYDSLYKKQFFQTNIEQFRGKLKSHVLENCTRSILKIHATINNLQNATSDLYWEIIEEQLKYQTTFLTELEMFDFLKIHWKTLDTRGKAQVFISLIENCKVDETSSMEDLINHAIERVTFWTCILGANGKHKHDLEEHPKYKLMKTTYENMYTNLEKNEYDYSFLQRLKRISKKKLLCVFEFVFDKSKPNIKESLEKSLDPVNIACKKLKVMTKICGEVSSKLPPDYQAVLKEGVLNMKEIMNELKGGKMKLCDVKNPEIFEIEEIISDRSLLQSCKEIKKVLPICSFWKGMNDFIQDEMNTIFAFEKRKDAIFTSEKKSQLILEFLSTYCISNFIRQMKRIMDEDIPLSQLFHFFRQEGMTVESLSKELGLIEKLIGCTKFSEEKTDAIRRCLDLNFNSKKIAALRKFQSNMNSTIEEKYDRQMKRFEEIQNNYLEPEWPTVNEINTFILDMESSVINFNEEVMGIIIEYSNSTHLISFLRDIIKEDIRNLMDSVEGKHFDQYLPMFFDLVEVKEFLHPILQLPDGTDTAVYISQIKKSLQKTEIQTAALKISHCSKELDSLKNFYKTFSNKTKKTKDRIENILKNGIFYFNLCEMDCTVEVKCIDGTKYTVSDLIDLRSRALLIKSRFEKINMKASLSNMTENLNLFLKTVRVATDILETYKQLKLLGHPLYEKDESVVELKGLVEKNESLNQICEEWRKDLDEYRQRYSCLKYIKSEHLQLLFNYTKNFGRGVDEKNLSIKEADIKPILWYLHQDLKFSLTEDCKPCDNVPRDYLEIIVNCLEDDFKKLEFKGKDFPSFIKTDSAEVMFSNKLNFIYVDKDSGAGLHVILGLFQMKCNKLPLPSQVVVCSDNTSWDELYLLLLRSREENKSREQNNVSDKCFCIAFLELLPVECQERLIHEIEKSDWNNSSLCLIYRGRQTDSIPILFKEYKISVQPIHRTLLEKILNTIFPDVVVFTSDSPGLGKTEGIRNFAASKEKSIKSLHISGPIKKPQLIQRFKELDLKTYEILHIEIGLVDKPVELDTFLFELILLRYVSFSSMSYSLPETIIALEIANCSNQVMVDNISFSMCFQREHLKWENYDNYKCQQVQNSPVQVACAYLGKLDDVDLNTNVDLSSISLIKDKKCQSLLRKYFPSFDGINFTIVDAFVSILGNQLKKFSTSSYFQSTNLILMIGEKETIAVRKIVIESLIQFSKEFALRSITSSRNLQHRTSEIFHTSSVDLKKAVMDLAVRTKNMIKWENSNHLVVVFHSQDTQTVSAVYRSLKDVPSNIKEMFESQIKDCLPDYANIESSKLLEIIVKLTRTKRKQLSKERMSILATGYAYTSDNMLKMLMIALRTQSNIPVIVMGETGCGKTSLIIKLAEICDVVLKILSVHAGIMEKEIVATVNLANDFATKNRGKEIWLFFDEINTSEYVGLISCIICHKELNGNALSPNLSFIAACNPYRVRESNRFTNGLQGKLSEDDLSFLAYRVHPLPENVLDFVWDYGVLPIQEEEAYIKRMIQSDIFYPHENLLIELLGKSQIFVREREGSSCIVSLRDVNRCIKLIKWFKEKFIPQRQKQIDTKELLLKSFIMGLTICYMCRFSNSDDRLEYRKKMADVFKSKSLTAYNEQEIAQCVKEEQDDIIERMDIPKGIAKNATLQENIFVMLVCILNKLPLFMVGKPGCSKSLSMKLIRNNMRGKDSRDELFQKYPRLVYSSFQGSESSTSDGIIKVFERAKRFLETNKDVLSLVILDEIGLAEISRFNPLKVLHSLLEPEEKEGTKVAVVGISNWSLDSAKMNRAIHLSRPDMNKQELFVTGQSIMESVDDQRSLDSILKDIAESYVDYIDQQPIENFHGLRDYYSFVKYVSREFSKISHPHCENDTHKRRKMLLLKGVLRNFGRIKKNNDAIKKTFFQRLLLNELPICDTETLIIENITDSEARHLMLMLDGDSALGSIESVIKKHDIDFTTILCSKFSEDDNEEYNYRVLNRIILCMEQPQVLILKDLDDIYGSLYDMLNQNYTIVKGKKHCRVALGPVSNPSCEVHDDFKCIVIIDESNVEKTDPPFLNRFEKQQYLLGDILKPQNKRLSKHLVGLFNDLSSYSKSNTFSAKDSFPIAGEEMFTSLVTLVEEKLSSYGNPTSETQVFHYCVLELLWILKPDCILRASISNASAKCRNSVKFLITTYMDLPIHNGLGYYLQEMCAVEKLTFSLHEDVKKNLVPSELKELSDIYLDKKEDDDCQIEFSREKIQYQMRRSDGYGAKLVVFTFTTIYCKIQDTLANLNHSFYKLSEYKSEKSFMRVVEEFFKFSKKQWFVLQCDMKLDYRSILLAKSIVENSRRSSMRNGETKNVCIVIHIMRSTNPVHVFNKINFSSGWTLATLDSIEKPISSLPYLYNKPVLDVFGANDQEFKEIIFRELSWAYARIQYQCISDNIKDVLKLKDSDFAVHFVSEQIQDWIKRHSETEDSAGWQHHAAFDKHLLEISATMNRTLQNYLSILIQQLLARILFSVENAGLMNCLLSFEELKPELQDVFRKGCKRKEFYNIDAVLTPSGPGCYIINLKNLKMRVPFSKLIFEKLENYKAEVLRDVRKNYIIPGYFKIVDDGRLMKTMLSIVRAHSCVIKQNTGLLNEIAFAKVVDDLTSDFCQFATSSIECRLTREEKMDLMKWIINQLKGNSDINNVSTLLLTLNLWTWTYFSNIIGIFHLVDFWKIRQKPVYDSSKLFYESDNEKKLLESVQDFVDSSCVDILVKCIQLKDGDVKSWQEEVSKFLCIINEIGVTSEKTETLKFFNELVSVVFTPTTCEYSHLNQFAIYVSKCNWNFKKLKVFETFWNYLKSLKKFVGVLKLQKVACSFIARCNVTDKTDLERKKVNLKAFNLIENGEMFDKSLRFYGRCLRLCLLDYARENKLHETNKFLQMLENDTSNGDPDEIVCAIHQILSKDDTASFSALFVMTLEDTVFCDVIGKVQLYNITKQNDALLQKLILAQDVLKSQCLGIRYYVAVAYLRKFLSVTVTLMLTDSYKNKYVLSAIDRLLCKDQNDVKQYFFECLKRSSGELGVFKLSKELSLSMQFLKTSTMRPSVESIGWSLMSLHLARYCILPDLLLLTSLSDITKEKAFLNNLNKGEKASVASLLCFLHCRLFYVESFSKTVDLDRLFVKSLQSAGVCYKNNNVKKLVNHLINQHNCQIEILKHNTEKSAENNSLTTFLIHIISLILIDDKSECTLYEAALHCKVSESKPNKIRASTKYQIRSCTCSHRIVSSDLSCPWCSSNKISGQLVTVFHPIKKEPISTIVRHILIDAALVTSCLFKDEVSEVVLKEVESREKNIKIRWQELREYLQVDDSEQCQLLMIFLEKVKGIFSDSAFSYSEWNPEYDEELREILKNRYHELRKDNIRHNEICRELGKKIAVKNNEKGENTKTNLLFCLTEKPSIHNLYFELHMSKAEDKFPCLNLILENFKMLHFPQFIEGILQWHKLLITKCSNRLRKVECKNITVDTFINQQKEEIQEDLRKTFRIFTDTWRKIITCIPMLEDHTTKLPRVKELTGSSTMDLCILKDINSTVFKVLNALCSWQNKLLDKVLATCVLCKSKALGFLEYGSNKAAFPVVALMDLQPRHIIKSMFGADSKRLELFSQIECTAETRNTNYDFRKLEIEWAFKVFYEKAHILIDETMMFMEFKDDLYGHCVQLLQKVSALIPQTTIDSAMEAKIKERLEDDSSQGPQLLTLIGTMTTIIVRRQTTDGCQRMAIFAKDLEELKLIGLSNSCLLPFKEYDLKLDKVVAFYTLLEEINGEKYFKALDIEFRDDIHDSTKQKIIHKISGQIPLLRACESAIYVFLHRHLYIRDNDINLQQPIADYLGSTELWKNAKISKQQIILPHFEILLQDVFPQDLLVKHVYNFIELLKEQISPNQDTYILQLNQESENVECF